MNNSLQNVKTVGEEIREQEKLTQIFLVVEQLFQRERATALCIIGCLYDIATVNWINKNIRSWPLNPLLKYIIRFPKPLAKILALRFYLQTQCPKLITDWLYSLVEFKEQEPEQTQTKEIKPESPPEIIESRQQVKLLRQRVKMLTGALVTTIAVFGGGFIWLVYTLDIKPAQLLQFSSTTTIIESEVNPK